MESTHGDSYAVRNEDGLCRWMSASRRILGDQFTMEALFDFQNPERDPATDDSDVSGGRFAFGGLGAHRGSVHRRRQLGRPQSHHSATTDLVDPEVPRRQQTGTVVPARVIRSIRTATARPDRAARPDSLRTSPSRTSAFCECEFLTWGYWSSEYRWSNNEGDNTNDPMNNAGRRDRGHINTRSSPASCPMRSTCKA